ncbi:unnamed protein product [Mycena citricolor]|uniref:White collar 1 protein n=1 Tax=Mycena citricolor TaxID=2018698 RepID=A0AAD2GUN0_9AGAR|nr:unnamed protein product [Mycena citricolor]
MSFSYLNFPFDEYNPETLQDQNDTQHQGHSQDNGMMQMPQSQSTIQFQFPEYLYDAAPTLAPGGGAEALHPAQAAQWFRNNGFQAHQSAAQPGAANAEDWERARIFGMPAVQDAYESLENLSNFSSSFGTSVSPFFNPDAAFMNPSPLSSASGTWSDESWSPSSTAFNPFQPSSHDNSLGRPLARALTTAPRSTSPAPLTASARLPLYSGSGFDALSLLARVMARPNPTIQLGPVDFSTSFVVVDVRRHDEPIVYCSPSFCALTGYSEKEVMGRNCRFLQAPPTSESSGELLPLAKGDPRHHTSHVAVRALAKAVGGHKESQVSVVNYRRDGSAFVNLVSIVPLVGESGVPGMEQDGEVVWYVGFQVDLTSQSESIVQRVKEGRYHKGVPLLSAPSMEDDGIKSESVPQRERRTNLVPAPLVSSLLARLLINPRFLASLDATPVSTVGALVPSTSGGGLPPDPSSHALHSILLGVLPDFIHVLSLKGAFLYVSPAVTRCLGWAPTELVGRSLEDICFSRDVVSVGRALKEASLPAEGWAGDKALGGTSSEALRVVDLVFRARTKQGTWVWVECRGRLHVEPGKGRKAIVLIGRARGMTHMPAPEKEKTPPTPTPISRQARHVSGSPTGSGSGLEWALQPKRARIEASDNLVGVAYRLTSGQGASTSPVSSPLPSATLPTAFHGVMDPYGLLLSVGVGANTVLGLEPASIRGTRIGALVVDSHAPSNPIESTLAAWRQEIPNGIRQIQCILQGKNGPVSAIVRFVAPAAERTPLPCAVAPAQLMYGVYLASCPPRPSPNANPFHRLDPNVGESWQYELSQLRFANERLIEEIQELERAEEKRAVKKAVEEEKQRIVSRYEVPEYSSYSNAGFTGVPLTLAGRRQQLQNDSASWQGRSAYPASSSSSSPYSLPMKRPWEDV